VRRINIEHNEVCNVSYTGISLGWGWTKESNVMKDNRVFANRVNHYAKHLYDVAGIYTLSAQPGTVISNNYIDSIYMAEYAHDSNHWFYLYTDEGSSYITVKNNWCPSMKFLQNANGPGNVWDGNGSAELYSVIERAGLQEKFQYLLTERSIDTQHPTQPSTYGYGFEILRPPDGIIEIVLSDSSAYYDEMLKILYKYGISIGGLLKWKNHFASFYPMIGDTTNLMREVSQKLPGSTVKIYSQLVYEFDRKRCKDSTESERTDFVWLSANLVDDPKFQQEYLDYHAKQYELWPEIAQGFCNAGFQRLEVYKSGRQLMLFIEFPEGKTLDELNPKTIENNPRMVEWNQLMKKYQEGIEGTKPGEVWVQFLNIIR
jgi:L-rhamnose mutarotase